MPAFRLGRQLPLDFGCLLLRQIDQRSGPNHCRGLALPIVYHPALGALANQKSGRWRRLVAHLAKLLGVDGSDRTSGHTVSGQPIAVKGTRNESRLLSLMLKLGVKSGTGGAESAIETRFIQ